jgi:hypothetical protein
LCALGLTRPRRQKAGDPLHSARGQPQSAWRCHAHLRQPIHFCILGVGGLEGGPKPPSQTERAIERRRGSARAHANDVNNIAALGSGSPIAVGFYCAVRHSIAMAGECKLLPDWRDDDGRAGKFSVAGEHSRSGRVGLAQLFIGLEISFSEPCFCGGRHYCADWDSAPFAGCWQKNLMSATARAFGDVHRNPPRFARLYKQQSRRPMSENRRLRFSPYAPSSSSAQKGIVGYQ